VHSLQAYTLRGFQIFEFGFSKIEKGKAGLYPTVALPGAIGVQLVRYAGDVMRSVPLCADWVGIVGIDERLKL
jgi:hypothetical protein